MYEIRGDGLAEEYFKIGADGTIRINKSLYLDDNKTPTYRVNSDYITCFVMFANLVKI